jgi:hypothetical protein
MATSNHRTHTDFIESLTPLSACGYLLREAGRHVPADAATIAALGAAAVARHDAGMTVAQAAAEAIAEVIG